MYKIQYYYDGKNNVQYSPDFFALVDFVMCLGKRISRGTCTNVTLSFIPGAQIISYSTDRKKKNPFAAFRDSSEEIVFTIDQKTAKNYLPETLLKYAQYNTPIPA